MWACPACTLENDTAAPYCGVCGGPRPAAALAPSSGAPASHHGDAPWSTPTARHGPATPQQAGPSAWQCPACTYENGGTEACCGMCGSSAPAVTPAAAAATVRPRSIPSATPGTLSAAPPPSRPQSPSHARAGKEEEDPTPSPMPDALTPASASASSSRSAAASASHSGTPLGTPAADEPLAARLRTAQEEGKWPRVPGLVMALLEEASARCDLSEELRLHVHLGEALLKLQRPSQAADAFGTCVALMAAARDGSSGGVAGSSDGSAVAAPLELATSAATADTTATTTLPSAADTQESSMTAKESSSLLTRCHAGTAEAHLQCGRYAEARKAAHALLTVASAVSPPDAVNQALAHWAVGCALQGLSMQRSTASDAAAEYRLGAMAAHERAVELAAGAGERHTERRARLALGKMLAAEDVRRGGAGRGDAIGTGATGTGATAAAAATASASPTASASVSPAMAHLERAADLADGLAELGSVCKQAAAALAGTRSSGGSGNDSRGGGGGVGGDNVGQLTFLRRWHSAVMAAAGEGAGAAGGATTAALMVSEAADALAAAHETAGSSAEAVPLLQSLLSAHTASHNEVARGQVLVRLGKCLRAVGDNETARGAFEQALSVAVALANRSAAAVAFANIGAVSLALRQSVKAGAAFASALSTFAAVRRSGDLPTAVDAFAEEHRSAYRGLILAMFVQQRLAEKKAARAVESGAASPEAARAKAQQLVCDAAAVADASAGRRLLDSLCLHDACVGTEPPKGVKEVPSWEPLRRSFSSVAPLEAQVWRGVVFVVYAPMKAVTAPAHGWVVDPRLGEAVNFRVAADEGGGGVLRGVRSGGGGGVVASAPAPGPDAGGGSAASALHRGLATLYTRWAKPAEALLAAKAARLASGTSLNVIVVPNSYLLSLPWAGVLATGLPAEVWARVGSVRAVPSIELHGLLVLRDRDRGSPPWHPSAYDGCKVGVGAGGITITTAGGAGDDLVGSGGLGGGAAASTSVSTSASAVSGAAMAGAVGGDVHKGMRRAHLYAVSGSGSGSDGDSSGDSGGGDGGGSDGGGSGGFGVACAAAAAQLVALGAAVGRAGGSFDDGDDDDDGDGDGGGGGGGAASPAAAAAPTAAAAPPSPSPSAAATGTSVDGIWLQGDGLTPDTLSTVLFGPRAAAQPPLDTAFVCTPLLTAGDVLRAWRVGQFRRPPRLVALYGSGTGSVEAAAEADALAELSAALLMAGTSTVVRVLWHAGAATPLLVARVHAVMHAPHLCADDAGTAPGAATTAVAATAATAASAASAGSGDKAAGQSAAAALHAAQAWLRTATPARLVSFASSVRMALASGAHASEFGGAFDAVAAAVTAGGDAGVRVGAGAGAVGAPPFAAPEFWAGVTVEGV